MSEFKGPFSSADAVQLKLIQLEEEIVSLQQEVAVATELAAANKLTLDTAVETGEQELWVFNLQLARFTYVSPSVERLFGMTVGRALSAGPDQTSNPETYRKVCGIFDMLFATGTPAVSKPRQGLSEPGLEVMVRTPQSTSLEKADYIIVARRTSGHARPMEIAGVVPRDGTEAVDMESKALLDDWMRFFRALPVSTVIVSGSYTALKINNALVKCTGCSPTDCDGRACSELVHTGGKRPEECPMPRTMQNRCVTESIIQEPRLGGPYLFHTGPLLDHDSCLVGGVCMGTDIGEMAFREESLRTNTVSLDLVQQTAKMGFWQMSATVPEQLTDDTPVWFASDLMVLLNSDYEEVPPVYASWKYIIHEQDFPKFHKMMQEFFDGKIRNGKCYFSCKDELDHREERRFRLDIISEKLGENKPANAAEPEQWNIFGVVREVTEERELLAELEEAKTQLDQTLEQMDAGSWSFTFERSKPLLPDLPFEISPTLGKLLGPDLMSGFNGTFGRLGKMFHPDDAQLSEAALIDNALSEAKSFSYECRLAAKTRGEEPRSLKVFGTTQRLPDGRIQAFGIGQIIKTPAVPTQPPPEPEIPIQAPTPPPRPAAVMPAYSETPLPPQAPPAPVPTQPMPAPPPQKAEPIQKSGPLDVLVIDNDALDRMTMEAILKRLGHRMHEMTGTEHLISEIKRLNPDCVITELIMPGATGEAVYREIRSKIGPDLPVVIASQTRLRFRSGKDDPRLVFVTKPCKDDAIAEVFRTLFR